MANFDIAFQRTIFHEGGYVNDPNDAGGETYMGISRRAHPKSRIWKVIDEDKRTNGLIGINKRLKDNNWLTACIKDIYKEEYWDRFELDSVRVQKIANEILNNSNAWFHVDAVQSVGHIPVDVKDLQCDMLSASGHKFGALKGIGFLYAQNEIGMKSIIYGGKQEQGVRGGTENLLGIISMAAALEDAVEHMEERNKHIKYLRNKMLNKLLQIPDSHLNGSLKNRVSSNINIRFDGVSGARLVTLCSLYGVYISSGSACNEGVSEPSHVLKAIGLSDEEALSSIRITIGHQNTEEEIDQATDIIIKLVERIRNE